MSPNSPAAQEGAGPVSIPDAMEAFSNLADAWGLSTEEQIHLLGSPGRSTYFKWKKSGGNVPNDTIERISHILAIYKALQILLPNEQAADRWIKAENDYFNGHSALDIMLQGKVVDIYRVRQYIDAQRGG